MSLAARVKKTGQVKGRIWPLIYQMQSLDTQNYGSWPRFVKVFIILLITLSMAVISYMLPIRQQLARIEAAQNQHQVLLAAANEKQLKLKQLPDNDAQIQALQQGFIEQIQRLGLLDSSDNSQPQSLTGEAVEPSFAERQMASGAAPSTLLQQITEAGRSNHIVFKNLALPTQSVTQKDSDNRSDQLMPADTVDAANPSSNKDISPQVRTAATAAKLFIEQPMTLLAVAEYQQLGGFLADLALLPKLIVAHDFELTRLKTGSTLQPQLSLRLQANAYVLSAETQAKLGNLALNSLSDSDNPKTTRTNRSHTDKTQTNSLPSTVYQTASNRDPFGFKSILVKHSAAPDVTVVQAGKPAANLDVNKADNLTNAVIPPAVWSGEGSGRIRQAMEYYGLSQLTYRGMMGWGAATTQGLVQRPDGVITAIKIGDYLGLHQGRVVEITPTHLNLVETVLIPETGKTKRRVSLIAPF